MARGAPDPGSVDEVQIFDADPTLTEGGVPGGLDMATSPNCDIDVLRTPPRGEQRLHDSAMDQILLVLKGECTVAGPSGDRALAINQGALVPAGVTSRLVNTADEDLVVLSLRTGSSEDRPGYVPNAPSGVLVKVPTKEIASKGIGRHVYVFAMNQRTIGIGINATEEWNRGSLLRMNCEYERSGDHILVNLPERMARWYRVRDLSESDYRILPDDGTRVRVDLGPLLEREGRS